MYENQTFDSIMNRALSRVSSSMDKRQGSMIWDALAPACYEIARMYTELDRILELTFAESSYGEYLDKRVAEMGLYRREASYAIRLGIMRDSKGNLKDIPLGSRFSIDSLNYMAVAKIQTGQYQMRCEQAGETGNQQFGRLIPVDNIAGLGAAELSDVLIPGENEETDEALLARYNEVVNETPFGGNIDDYKQKVKAVNGVGDCKITPVWNGGGTVKVTAIDASFHSPSDTLLNEIQTVLDPKPEQGQGLGLAPIGHVVTVEGVEEKAIDLATTLTVKSGVQVSGLLGEAEEITQTYFKELRQSWAMEDAIIVRLNQLEARLLQMEGVLDIEGTTLNGSAENITLSWDCVPVLGQVILNG